MGPARVAAQVGQRVVGALEAAAQALQQLGGALAEQTPAEDRLAQLARRRGAPGPAPPEEARERPDDRADRQRRGQVAQRVGVVDRLHALERVALRRRARRGGRGRRRHADRPELREDPGEDGDRHPGEEGGDVDQRQQDQLQHHEDRRQRPDDRPQQPPGEEAGDQRADR